MQERFAKGATLHLYKIAWSAANLANSAASLGLAGQDLADVLKNGLKLAEVIYERSITKLLFWLRSVLNTGGYNSFHMSQHIDYMYDDGILLKAVTCEGMFIYSLKKFCALLP